MSRQELTITITEAESGELPFDAFADVVMRTVRILRGLDRQLSEGHEPTAEWQIIDARMTSPLSLTLAPRPIRGRTSTDAVGAFIDDFERMEGGQPARHMTPGLQQHARGIVGRLGRGVVAVDYRSNGRSTRPTARLAATVVQSLSAVRFGIGTVEGQLELISVHGGDRVKVWDRRFNTPVDCKVSDMQLEEAKTALGKRVAVRGRIEYQSRRPRSVIDVFDIRILRDADALPQPDMIGPIDLMGDVDPVEYLRGDSDGE